jgi:hypothetical protein
MSVPSQLFTVMFEKCATFLAAFFLEQAGGDAALARQHAATVLRNEQPRTADEVRLITLTLAFDFGALDALGQAASAELSINQKLRLRGNAVALGKASTQHHQALDRLRDPRQDAAPEETASSEALPTSKAPADLISFARANPAPMSRQQRREAERRAEKARRSQENAARLAERATRMAEPRHAAQ